LLRELLDREREGLSFRKSRSKRRKEVEVMGKLMRNGVGLVALVVAACMLSGSAAAHATVAAPTIISFTPTHALVGATVTIYGHNLTGAQVQFNGMAASQVTVDTAGTHVKAIVDPETMDGPAQIGVITSGGTITSTAIFTVDPPTGAATQTGKAKAEKPLIKSIAPLRGKAGAKITIKGVNFGGAMWVKFGSVKALYTIPTAGEIIARVPKKASSGEISIRTGLGIATRTLHFTVTAG